MILALVSIIGTAPALAQNAYITNYLDGTVSVIDTETNKVVGSPIVVGSGPFGVAVTPDGRHRATAPFRTKHRAVRS
jgi:YVTN family beta-propeller protein